MLIAIRGQFFSRRGFQHYEQARLAPAWNPKTDIEWEQPTPLTPKRQELACYIASQAAHAEQVGLVTAARLLGETEDYPARLALATATSDEAKHSEVFARYASKRGGAIAAPKKSVQKLSDSLDELNDYLGRFLIHSILQAFAADEMLLFIRVFEGDTLGSIDRYVRRDEGGHVGMGF